MLDLLADVVARRSLFEASDNFTGVFIALRDLLAIKLHDGTRPICNVVRHFAEEEILREREAN